MEQHNDTTRTSTSGAGFTLTPALMGWAIAAIVLAIITVIFNKSPTVLGAGFFMKLLAAIIGSVTGFIGAWIGDAIRKFARPDAVFTSGGMLNLMGIKLFWLLGPQTIGLALGVFLGCGFMLR